MDNETIDDYDRDLAARLGVKGVAELRSLHVKAARLALMIRDKLALPNGGVAYCIATDGVGIVGLADDMCVTVFPPRVIEVFHGVKAVFRQPHCGVPVVALVSRELERVLGSVNRLNSEIFTVEFEGETFVIEVWLNGDDVDVIADMYDEFGLHRACFCDLVDRRPADVTTEGAV